MEREGLTFWANKLLNDALRDIWETLAKEASEPSVAQEALRDALRLAYKAYASELAQRGSLDAGFAEMVKLFKLFGMSEGNEDE